MTAVPAARDVAAGTGATVGQSSSRATRAPSLPVVRCLGRVGYRVTLEAMRTFTEERGHDSPDELWALEHPPVYTVGLAGRAEHLPRRDDIPLERVDRGGQVTYHGPGQAVVYTLVDLARARLTVRGLVHLLEQVMIDDLAALGVAAERRTGAPGVYVGAAKIGALGVRVRRGRAYHGLAYNVAMDLSPFLAIDPCGYPGLVVTDLATLGIADGAAAAGERLAFRLATLLERHGHETR
jgi:lipoyl(octanoyl) transferase